MTTDRLPPHDIQAEEAVLGSILIDGDAFSRVASIINHSDFFREQHSWIFDACAALDGRREAINQVTVAHELAQANRLDSMGGMAFLGQLVIQVPTSVHAEHYARIVQRTALQRRLINAANQIAVYAYEAGADVEGALTRAEEALFNLREGQTPRDFKHIRKLLDQFFEEGEQATRAGAEPKTHILTGFIDLDAILGGFQRSDLIILAARPSIGKSSLALNIARNAAVDQGASVAVFSLEMSKEQVAQRFLSAEGGVESQRLRTMWEHGRENRAEERRLIEAAGRLSQTEIYIDDSPLIDLHELRSKARLLQNERGVDLIIVDYLQLVAGGARHENRVQEISYISRTLKGLARELNAPVLAVSQLSRAVETRSPHVPMLSDLRESGAIEQDADVVLFIYREDIYYTEEEWNRRNVDTPYPRGIADIIVAKHRNGPTGQVQFLFLDRFARFANLAQDRS